jgi:hypothetical protein
MTLKTFKSFKEFIEENFRSSLPGKGFINSNDKDEINYYHETLNTLNLNDYMATFTHSSNKDAVNNFLTNPDYGKPPFLRFFLVYYNNYFTIYVFHGYIRHTYFVDLLNNKLSSLVVKPIPIDDYTTLYNDCFKRKLYDENDPKAERNKLEELKTIWCLPGLYDRGKIETNASRKYMNLIAKLDFHKKLGFSDETWSSTKIKI